LLLPAAHVATVLATGFPALLSGQAEAAALSLGCSFGDVAPALLS